MGFTIAELKQNQSQLLAKIKEKTEGGGYTQEKDERFWQPTFDETSGGGAVIRFLPSPDGIDAMPYEKLIKHFFRGIDGKVYAENSLRTLGEKDPVADLNYRLYNSNVSSNQEQAKNQKQRPRYYANIYVINDIGNPDNNGKVFLYEFGPAIYKLIEQCLNPNDPTEPDKKPQNPFNVLKAPKLTLKLLPQPLGKKKNGQPNIVPNYGKSQFDNEETPIADNEEEIIDIVNQGYSLKEFVAPSLFKTYDELATKLVEVLGPTTGTGFETVVGYNSGIDEKEVEKQLNKEIKSSTCNSTTSNQEINNVVNNTSNDDEDDEFERLRKLMQED